MNYISKRAKVVSDKPSYKKKEKSESGGTIYRYDEKHIEKRWKEKKEKLKKLEKNMGKLKSVLNKDLTSDDERTRAIAAIVCIMEETGMRVGNEESAKEGTYGASTLKKRHVKSSGGKMKFDFPGKGAIEQHVEISDKKVIKVVKDLMSSKKADDFVFEVEGKKIWDRAVNRYLSPHDISAKDLRGYKANHLMKEVLKKQKDFKKALDEVAEIVGHEPATLKNQYLDPELVEKYEGKDKKDDGDKKKKKSALSIRDRISKRSDVMFRPSTKLPTGRDAQVAAFKSFDKSVLSKGLGDVSFNDDLAAPTKPANVFWTSTLSGDTTEWLQFALGEQFRDYRKSEAALLDASGTKVYPINDASDYEYLLETFPRKHAVGHTVIDWDEIAKHYDGVRVTNPHDSLPFNQSWDVESTAWFKPEKLKLVDVGAISAPKEIDEYTQEWFDWKDRPKEEEEYDEEEYYNDRHSKLSIRDGISKRAGTIDFPADERKSIERRLDDDKSVYTTRVKNEMGKYKSGETYDSPVGKLKVEEIKQLDDIKDHPFVDDITEAQKEQISGEEYELIKLKKAISKRAELTPEDKEWVQSIKPDKSNSGFNQSVEIGEDAKQSLRMKPNVKANQLLLDAWRTLQPFMPPSAMMTSGFRTPEDQKRILDNYFNKATGRRVPRNLWNDNEVWGKLSNYLKQQHGLVVGPPWTKAKYAHLNGNAMDISGGDLSEIASMVQAVSNHPGLPVKLRKPLIEWNNNAVHVGVEQATYDANAVNQVLSATRRASIKQDMVKCGVDEETAEDASSALEEWDEVMGFGIDDEMGDWFEKSPMFRFREEEDEPDHEIHDVKDSEARKMIEEDPEQFFYQGLHKELPDLEVEALKKVIENNAKFFFVFKYHEREEDEFQDLVEKAAELLSQQDARAFFYYHLHHKYPELGRGAIIQLIDTNPDSYYDLGLQKDYPDYEESAGAARNIKDPNKIELELDQLEQIVERPLSNRDASKKKLISKRADMPHGWWISPSAELYPVGYRGHIGFVLENLGLFGIDLANPDSELAELAGENQELDANDLYGYVFRKGWSRAMLKGSVIIVEVSSFDTSNLKRLQHAFFSLPPSLQIKVNIPPSTEFFGPITIGEFFEIESFRDMGKNIGYVRDKLSKRAFNKEEFADEREYAEYESKMDPGTYFRRKLNIKYPEFESVAAGRIAPEAFFEFNLHQKYPQMLEDKIRYVIDFEYPVGNNGAEYFAQEMPAEYFSLNLHKQYPRFLDIAKQNLIKKQEGALTNINRPESAVAYANELYEKGIRAFIHVNSIEGLSGISDVPGEISVSTWDSSKSLFITETPAIGAIFEGKASAAFEHDVSSTVNNMGLREADKDFNEETMEEMKGAYQEGGILGKDQELWDEAWFNPNIPGNKLTGFVIIGNPEDEAYQEKREQVGKLAEKHGVSFVEMGGDPRNMEQIREKPMMRDTEQINPLVNKYRDIPEMREYASKISQRDLGISKRAGDNRWWLSPDGQLYDAGEGHIDFVQRNPEIFETPKYELPEYDDAFNKGWARLLKSYGKSITAEIPNDSEKVFRNLRDAIFNIPDVEFVIIEAPSGYGRTTINDFYEARDLNDFFRMSDDRLKLSQRDLGISKRAKKDEPVSYGVFIELPSQLTKQFPSLGEHDDSKPHITVLYIGKKVKPEQHDLLLTTMERTIENWMPFVVELDKKVSYFPPTKHSDDCKVAKMVVVSKELHRLHKELKKSLLDVGIDIDDHFPNYKPHVTLEYMEPPREKYDGKIPSGSWLVDTLGIWGDKKKLKLKKVLSGRE